MATVGSGDFKYELVQSWPNLPKYWEMGLASDGAVNSRNEVHIFSRGLHPLTIWDTDGNFISSWGEGTFSANPHGIYIAPNDNVWLIDRDFHIATEYTPDGQPLRTLGSKLAPSPSFQGMPFNMPQGSFKSTLGSPSKVRPTTSPVMCNVTLTLSPKFIVIAPSWTLERRSPGFGPSGGTLPEFDKIIDIFNKLSTTFSKEQEIFTSVVNKYL